jgi:hypothetical protein
MMSVPFPDANVELTAPPGLEDKILPIKAYSGPDGSGNHCFVTAWKPNRDDLEAINRGEPIYIKVNSFGFAPMAVYTYDDKGHCNDS